MRNKELARNNKQSFIIIEKLARIQKRLQDFLVEVVRKKFMFPFFEGCDKILLLGEALKFGENFEKNCIKLIKTIKTYAENFGQMQSFHENFRFLSALWGKIGIIIYSRGVMAVRGLSPPPKLETFKIILSKTQLQNCKIEILEFKGTFPSKVDEFTIILSRNAIAKLKILRTFRTFYENFSEKQICGWDSGVIFEKVIFPGNRYKHTECIQ